MEIVAVVGELVDHDVIWQEMACMPETVVVAVVVQLQRKDALWV